MIIAVSGWRHWTDREFLYAQLNHLVSLYGNVHIRVGDATGVDAMVWDWRADLAASSDVPYGGEVTVSRCLANWTAYGKTAGPIRNMEMLTGRDAGGRHAVLLVAFPQPGVRMQVSGSGTWGCIAQAHLLGIPVQIPGYTVTKDQTAVKLREKRS